MRTRADALDEPAEDLTFSVFGGRGVQPALVTQGLVRIADDDPGAVVDLVGTAVRTSPLLETSVRAVREALGSVRWPSLRLPALFG